MSILTQQRKECHQQRPRQRTTKCWNAGIGGLAREGKVGDGMLVVGMLIFRLDAGILTDGMPREQRLKDRRLLVDYEMLRLGDGLVRDETARDGTTGHGGPKKEMLENGMLIVGSEM